jgi:dTDP-4-amino-4,6-dideoxygalactose transaminase
MLAELKQSIPLAETSLGPEEIAAVARVLEGGWVTAGSVTAEFENRFAGLIGAKHAIAVSNCTAALHLANVALGVGPGDEVICPALTFVATANASRYTGATVVFADSRSPLDLTVDPGAIEDAITPRTKAISVVHYAGFACDLQAIAAIAKRFGLRLIEDCAHSPLGRAESLPSQPFTGTIGDIGCFSFFGNKNMTTGEGGMVTTNDDELARKIRLLRSHGMTSLSYERHKGHASAYDVIGLGFNYRIDEIRSAIGLCQLEKLESLNRQRRQVTAWYREELAENRHVTIPFLQRDLEWPACHIMPVIVDRDAADVRLGMAKAGIQTSKHYRPVPEFAIYGSRSGSIQSFPIEGLMTLPLSPFMTPDMVAAIAQHLKRLCTS